MIQISVEVLFSLFARQPCSPQSNITNALAFISQFINGCFCRELKVLFGLYVVCFCREQSGDFGEVRQYARYFIQADSPDFDIDILQRDRISLYRMHTESHAFIIPHIHIGIHAHILVQINPVMIFVEMEFTERNNRFFRNQCKGQSIPFSTSPNQRTGIDSEQHTGFPLFVLIFCQQLGIAVANLTCQNSGEGKLGILRSVDYSGTEIHTGSILFDGEKDRIQLQGIHFQSMDGCFAVDSPIGSSAEFHGSIMERYILHCHIVCQRILLSCRERENSRRQCFTQSSMIQEFFIHLLHQHIYKMGRLTNQRIYTGTGTQIQFHITGGEMSENTVLPCLSA